jgi:all-trans-8'-apo-beta-carotenal 15,15'-oxygenase
MKKNTVDRRAFLKLSVAGLASSSSVSVAQTKIFSGSEDRYPLRVSDWRNQLANTDMPYSGLVSSLRSENNYTCEVRGELPTDLEGTLYRTGPGIFERGDMRRRMVIDGDGMMRKFKFSNGQVTFSNKHIRTEKFNDEEKAGRYLYPSFGMLIPENGFLANSVANMKTQASVSAFTFGGRLFATDEMQSITELDPQTLKTVTGASVFGTDQYKAHFRISHFGRKILHLARFNVMTSGLQFITYNENFEITGQSNSVTVKRSFHDWHVTPNYYVILLPPTYINKWAMMKAVAGTATIGDAIEYNKNEKAQVLVIPRDGRAARAYNLTEAVQSWHSVNAFEDSSGQIVFDFVTSKAVGSSVSKQNPMCKIMSGTLSINKTLRSTVVSRAVIDFNRNKATYSADCFGLHGIEMPTIDSQLTGLEQDNAYFMAGQDGVDSQVVRLDYRRNVIDRFQFGSGHFVTEPIYARSTQDASRGYLLSEVYVHADRKSRLAIFDAQNLARGPIGEVLLTHHLPIGFHGFWA